jgi:hypothetical protein
MVPSTIRNNLAALRRRERFLTFVWGAACWLAIGLVLLFLCGFVDWLIDRQRETPMDVRYGLFGVQAVVAALAGLVFVLWPQLRRLPDALLALWVEEKIPQFDHRLISAVQFNQPGAQLEGMSKELVAVVTREAEKQAQHVGGFAQVADHSRLKWTALVLTPILLAIALPLALWPNLCFALLARQGLLDVEVPHSVKMKSASKEFWPIGEDIKIYYRVTGEYNRDMIGSVYVEPEGQAGDSYPLEFLTEDADGAIFSADVRPSSVDVRYSARLEDGRPRYPSVLRVVPRPVVKENKAWLLLPEFCGKLPDGRRYEQPQGRGDVVGIPGSSVRVQFEVDTLQHQAWLELLEYEKVEPARKISMEVRKGVKEITEDGVTKQIDIAVAEATFDLAEALTGYRMFVKDSHEFENIPAPRRSLRLIAEPPPQVTLLRDTFGLGADYDVEGMPIPLGLKIRIPYRCEGPYGLGKAEILYRILKKQESGDDPVEEDRWVRSPLPRVQPDNTAGPFDPQTGVFKNTPFTEAVPFYAAPFTLELGRAVGGGRAFLVTKGLIDTSRLGKTLELKAGDHVEYCIKVYAAHREPAESTPYVISATRVTKVVGEREFSDWITELGLEAKRLKEIEDKEKGVFSPK